MQELTKEIQVLTNEQQPLIALAENIVVENSEQNAIAVERSGDIKNALKKIEEKRLSFTKPLNESLKNINKTFKELCAPLAMAVGLIDGAIHKYRARERERIAESTRNIQAEEDRRNKIRAAHEAKGHKTTAPVELLKPAPIEVTDMTPVRKDWKWEIIDPNLVTREYLQVDQVLVTKAVRAGVRSIPGIRIFEKETIINRNPKFS